MKFLKIFGIIILIIIILLVGFYIYLAKKSYNPENKMELGITFSDKYARELGIDWKTAYMDLLDEMNIKFVRVPAYWDVLEYREDRYQWDYVDFMMNEAKNRNVGVVLVLGRRQPRWPECHEPEWTMSLNQAELAEKETKFIREVVKRYRLHPALEMWQLENEPFLDVFGECLPMTERHLKDLIKEVRNIDDKNLIMITASGELSPWFKEIYLGDVFGTTMYRWVHNSYLGFWHYWFLPASFYRVKAAFWGKPLESVYVAELQAEPWATTGDILTTPLDAQNRTMNAEILKDNVEYAKRTNFYRSYLWGAEWWYWLKNVKGDDSVWQAAKEIFNQ